ncbi:MAG: glycoside hydrolase family 99-like domain-containing protein [Acidobacteriota bacterium]
MNKTRARLIAFYLPQFYPTPENDRWWGKGFTEWTNVAKARPLFDSHYQPHLPANLGFYDLRVPEVREAQARLAQSHGIEGFCYWHYWFHGKRVLERPFSEVLSSGRPDFPFCLGWANETWSRRWHGSGAANEVLVEQKYSTEDDRDHIRWLIKAFVDPRYIKVHGRPLLLIYRPTDLPNPNLTTDIFREECVAHGLPEPYLVASNSHKDLDYRGLGFDRTMEFEPQLGLMPGPNDNGLKIYDYAIARDRMGGRKRDFPIFPAIFVRWDNTPRRADNGIVFINSTPEKFEEGLDRLVNSVEDVPYDDRVVFINAWNEWAEGNHLEPDLKYGLQYLEAVKRVNEPWQNGLVPSNPRTMSRILPPHSAD